MPQREIHGVTMTDKYILKDRVPVPCENLLDWARWFETADRHVAKSVNDKVRVSTVFLGLDHQWGKGPPMLFETMIFGGEHDQYQERCSTFEEAKMMHKKACELAGVE